MVIEGFWKSKFTQGACSGQGCAKTEHVVTSEAKERVGGGGRKTLGEADLEQQTEQ